MLMVSFQLKKVAQQQGVFGADLQLEATLSQMRRLLLSLE